MRSVFIFLFSIQLFSKSLSQEDKFIYFFNLSAYSSIWIIDSSELIIKILKSVTIENRKETEKLLINWRFTNLIESVRHARPTASFITAQL